MLRLALLAAAAAAAAAYDESIYRRLTPAEAERAFRDDDAPKIPFKNFSAAYVQRALATSVSWVEKGAVTPVKDQGPHGYCGTFGRVGNAEGQWVLRGGGSLTSFSEEELVDCVGWDKDQFSFFSVKGFTTSARYPYNETAYPDADPPIPGNPCKYDPSNTVVGTPSYFNATTGGAPDEDQMAAFILHNGPVAAGINADVFGLRAKGCEATGSCFITQADCAKVSQEIDHSIVVVGYGTDAVNGPFWLIKNSWSTSFANGGYINVARGINCAGLCGNAGICGNVFASGDSSAYYE
jgi:C1A family cysteine protease